MPKETISLDSLYGKKFTKKQVEPEFEVFDNIKDIDNCDIDPDVNTLGLEMATILPVNPSSLNIKIIVRSDDHGYMDELKVLRDEQLPAHAHVFTRGNQKLGLLNITGPQPTDESQINQYYEKKDNSEKPFSSNTKKEILKWCSMKSKFSNKLNCWETAVGLWNTYHPNNKLIGGV